MLADGDRAGGLRHAPQGANDVFVCTNISCSLRGADAIYEAMLSAAGDDPSFSVRSFECLGACDIAPMASVNGEYVGPLSTDDAERIVDDLRAGREVLPEKNLRLRPCQDPNAPGDGVAPGPHDAAHDGHAPSD